MKKYGKLYQAKMKASMLATMYVSAGAALMRLTITGGKNPEKIEAEIKNILAFVHGEDLCQ